MSTRLLEKLVMLNWTSNTFHKLHGAMFHRNIISNWFHLYRRWTRVTELIKLNKNSAIGSSFLMILKIYKICFWYTVSFFILTNLSFILAIWISSYKFSTLRTKFPSCPHGTYTQTCVHTHGTCTQRNLTPLLNYFSHLSLPELP